MGSDRWAERKKPSGFVATQKEKKVYGTAIKKEGLTSKVGKKLLNLRDRLQDYLRLIVFSVIPLINL